jgi:probable F420-dependent oxidoreductase
MEPLRISLGVFGLERLFGGDPRALIEVAREADAAGVDQINLTDHVVMGARTDRYPFGKFPLPPEYPWFEPLTLLSAMAGLTSRIRLATGVLITPLRPAVLLAKIAATLDVVSGGRLDLGVGTGWQREEYEASGIPFAGRMARMDDQLRACRVLWHGDEPASFASETVSFAGIWSNPRPAQTPLPLWFGIAPTEDNARRIAELGQGWLPIYPDPEYIRTGVEVVRRAFEVARRDPAELRVRALTPVRYDAKGVGDLDAAITAIDAARAAGATDIEFMAASFVRRAGDLSTFLGRIGKLSVVSR